MHIMYMCTCVYTCVYVYVHVCVYICGVCVYDGRHFVCTMYMYVHVGQILQRRPMYNM
jgi:hypothetical protein